MKYYNTPNAELFLADPADRLMLTTSGEPSINDDENSLDFENPEA